MTNTISEALESRAVSPLAVKPDGPLTVPRSFGVYELPPSVSGTRLFRFGNHPVRLHELEREFGSCKLLYLFLARTDAIDMASALNGREL